MLSATLDNLLNRGLPRSPRARQLCAELEGKSVAIEIRDITRLRMTSTGQTLTVTRDEAPADATLAGGPLSLLALAGESPDAVLQRGVRPDLEEELSLLLGDVPAHQLGRLARLTLDWSCKAASTTLTNLAEYLGHERADLVPRNEGEQFLRGVDAVREGVDRLAARIELVARRRGAP